MVSRVSFQSGRDQYLSPDCLISEVEIRSCPQVAFYNQVEISSGRQGVLQVRCISVVVPRVSYRSSGDQ